MVRSAATPRVSNHEATIQQNAELELPVRIRIDQAAPAAAVERGPFAFRLRQTVGHRIDRRGIMAHAAMAAFDLDAFGGCRGLLHAALPSADAVGTAEDRGGRHRRGAPQRSTGTPVFFVGAATARPLLNTPR